MSILHTRNLEIPASLRAELRASHAGEAGAVWIYRGVLFINWFKRDPEVDAFAKHHLATEKSHLKGFEANIHYFRGSLLLFFWGIAGFLTGAIPMLLGKDWMYYTIYCVESFVDQHYREQFEQFSTESHPVIIRFLTEMRLFHADEVEHRDQALAAMQKSPTRLMKIWGTIVATGSALAVSLAKRI